MKKLIIITMLLATCVSSGIYSAQVVWPIKGFGDYQLGKAMPESSRKTAKLPYSFSQDTKTHRLVLVGDEKKKIIMVRVDYKYADAEKVVAAYKEMVKKKAKRHGPGEGKEEATLKGEESYKITRFKRVLTISKHGLLLRLTYKFQKFVPKPKPE